MKLNKDATCAVIGHGSWATAIVKILCENEQSVGWYVRNSEVLESLSDKGINIKYLRNIEFDTSKIVVSDDINQVVAAADIVILATPSSYLKLYLEPLTVSLKDKLIISAIKGIVPEQYQTVTEYIHSRYDIPFSQLGVVTGPSHAEEVSQGKLSYLTVVCPDIDNARVLENKIKTKFINTTISTDLYGIEYATVLKNIYALAVGLAVGLGYGDNFIAVLTANCAREMSTFLRKSYPDIRETRASAYLGDLLVTCYSTHSRNRRLGVLIGKGLTVKSALNEMTMIAEGYFAAETIHHINKRCGVEMPIANMVYNILYNQDSARKAMSRLTKELI